MTRDEQDEYVHVNEIQNARAASCEHEPDDAGTCCRWCGIPAQRADLSPDALALLADLNRDRSKEYWRGEAMREGAAFDRTTWRRAHSGPPWPVTDHAIRVHAAALGIVPSRTDPDARQRQRELGDVWAGIIAARADKTTHEQRDYESSDAFEERQQTSSHYRRTSWPIIAAALAPVARTDDQQPGTYVGHDGREYQHAD